MIDYSKWPKHFRAVSNIHLDRNNPRLPEELQGKASEKQIINHLIEEEGLIGLARSISKHGYWPNEMPYIVKERSRFVVIEGNRRVSACKVLLDPMLAPKNKQKTFINLAKNIKPALLKKIESIIAPSRDDVDIIIEARHTNPQIKPWGVIKKARFYYYKLTQGETIESLEKKFQTNEITAYVSRYFMYEETKKLDLNGELKEKLNNETSFPLTNLERIFNFKSGKKFLGVSFNPDGTFNRHIPEDEYTNRLKFIVEGLLENKFNSRTMNKDKELKSYLEDFFNNGTFDSSIKMDKENINVTLNEIGQEGLESSLPLEDQNTSTKSKRKPKLTRKNYLIPKEFICNTGIIRIDTIADELQNKLSLDKMPNAAAILFRSFLDMITYRYILSNDLLPELKKMKSKEIMKNHKAIGKKILKELASLEFKITLDPNKEFPRSLNGGVPKDWLPSLMIMLSFIVENQIIEDPKLHHALKQYISKGNKFLNHHDFNLFVHNEFVIPNKDELKELWDNLSGVIQILIEDLNKKNIEKQQPQLN
ncbi:ParB/Srx family N-terminal domain-containing protein [Marinifilum sp. D714]|uniref:ParB/Srx family N-terminal domain-containing protein n=1 Tax=Marinifilum sp. D714 TaxID=2937523 RepID=UPI0027C8CDD7|nr:ParB/Srx family N-terminal domain-containing protein [Marinifilum sp. D714]MDQ2177080.1 ParB/Srx family N-terminal domain-containing protein [Marinifilum sp. D714]